jgi:hypothetical protein
LPDGQISCGDFSRGGARKAAFERQKRVRGKTDFASHFNPFGPFKACLKK